jgi:hypothetical protein
MGKGITLAKEELEKLRDVLGGIKRIGHKTESVRKRRKAALAVGRLFTMPECLVFRRKKVW